ncbi:hypothetical protein VTG60DRAFT_332 [Thermothelomyces hinnuleus]
MRLPPPGPPRDKAREKRLLDELVHVLTDPVCKAFPNSLGCTAAEPDPDPSPDPAPTPTPTPTQPAVTSAPVANPPAQSSPVQAPQPTTNPQTSADPVRQQPPRPTETASTGSGKSDGSGGNSNGSGGKSDPPAGSDSPGSGSNGGSSGSGSSDPSDPGSSKTGPGPTNGSSGSSGSDGTSGAGSSSGHGGGSTTGGDGGSNNTGGDKSAGGNGSGSENGGGHDGSQDSGNTPPTTHKQGDGESHSGSSTATGGVDVDDDGVPVVPQKGTHNDTPTTPGGATTPGETATPGSLTGDGISRTDWGNLAAGNDATHGSGTNGGSAGSGGDGIDGSNGNGNGSSSDGTSHPSSLPGIIGGVVAILVLLFVLLALVLYKYRHKRRVQAFLAKYTPFRTSGYTDIEKKRSSMGAGLLFTDGSHGDVLMQQNRSTFRYGTMVSSAVEQPHPAATPRERPDGPPQIITTTLPARRPGTPLSPFEVSPLSSGYPQSPPPAVARRSSQDSVGGVSIASSGVFSPSLLSWPAPPSAAPSTTTSPPPSSHGNLADLAAKYKPLTPTKPTDPLNRSSIRAVSPTPASPSTWQKPADWD